MSLRLDNVSNDHINIGPSSIVVYAIQNRDTNGTWENLIQYSSYFDETTTYARCSALPPGKTVSIPNVDVGLTLLKKQLAQLPEEPVMRFQLQTLCKLADDKIVGMPAFMTEPVRLRLPLPPAGTPDRK